MRYRAFACDYDGTLASRGEVDDATLAALDRLGRSGRRLVLLTGRQLEDLIRVFPQVGIFDRVIAENGALLYRPHGQVEELLGERPPAVLIDALRRRGVGSLSGGWVIFATQE